MKRILNLIALLTIAVSTFAQSPASKPDLPPAPISCTPKVPGNICEMVSSQFKFFHTLPKMSQIELVIADQESFNQERIRIESIFNMRVQNAKGDQFARAFNKKPTAPSDFDTLLLILDDRDGILRPITKIIISLDSFRTDGTVLKDGSFGFTKPIALSPSDYDPGLITQNQFYIMGYVEAWLNSALIALAANGSR